MHPRHVTDDAPSPHAQPRNRRILIARLGFVLSVSGIIVCLALAVYFSSKNRSAMQDVIEQVNRNFSLWEGVTAPDLTVTTIDGKTIRLSDLKGKRVVLDVWATWCPACLQQMPGLVKLYDKTKRDDLVILGISREDSKTLDDFVRKNRINYPIASVSDLPAPYSLDIILPTTYFIDRHGIIQSITIGYSNDAELAARALMSDYQGPPKPIPTNSIAILTNAS